MLYNLRPPEPRQFSPALITMLCQVWNRWTYPLPYYSVFFCWYITLHRDLDLWPSTWTSAAYHLWRDKTLYQIWTQLSNPRWSYCDFSVWPYDREHVLSFALGSGIIFIKFDLRQLIRAWIIAFYDADTLCHVWPWLRPIDLKSSWYVKRHVIKVCTRAGFNWWEAWGPVYLGGTGRLQQLYD